jgi:DNA-binding MarR family transcriptional regulator
MPTQAPAPPVADLAFLLAQTAHAIATELTAALEELDVTPRAQCVLSRAAQGEYTQSQLAEQSGLDKTTMVVTMDALERAGLAERKPSPHDRRARIIALTPAGHALVQRAQAIVERVQRDVLSTLPEEQREAFMTGLMTLAAQRLGASAECSNPPRRRKGA